MRTKNLINMYRTHFSQLFCILHGFQNLSENYLLGYKKDPLYVIFLTYISFSEFLVGRILQRQGLAIPSELVTFVTKKRLFIKLKKLIKMWQPPLTHRVIKYLLLIFIPTEYSYFIKISQNMYQVVSKFSPPLTL